MSETIADLVRSNMLPRNNRGLQEPGAMGNSEHIGSQQGAMSTALKTWPLSALMHFIMICQEYPS